jgi:4-hydroxybenzoate polyprenyltransferase
MLATCIVLYDGLVKQTPIGPIAMGACRTLNVLLGMSLGTTSSPHNWPAESWLIGAAIGIYTAGVTWFARSEAGQSKRTTLIMGLIAMLGGVSILALLPKWSSPAWLQEINNRGWQLFWIVIGLIIARRCAHAIVNPTPARVQAAVKHAILSLITIDAAVTLGFCGVFWGCAVLFLLIPAILFGRWVYMT